MNQISRLIVLVSLLSAFASSALAAYEPLDTIVATAANDVITKSDLDQKVAIVKQNLAQQNRPMPDDKEIRKQVLDKLIIESLQMQLAEQAGLEVSDQQLAIAMNRIAKRQNMTEQQLREKVESDGMSYDEMREQIRQDITLQQLQQSRLRHKIQISEEEVENFLNSAEGKKLTASDYKISYLVLELPESASKADVQKALKTMTDVRKGIATGKYNFDNLEKGQTIAGYTIHGQSLDWMTKEQLPTLFAKVIPHLSKGSVSKPLRSGAGWHMIKLDDVSGGSSKIVHQVSSRHILIKPSEVRTDEQAQKLAQDIYDRIKKGEDFSLLAKEYSEDPGSSLQGGQLGWSDPTEYTPAFTKVLKNLKKDEISKPFKTEFGWHIVQKLDERDHDMTLENQKNQAYQALYQRKFAEELETWLVTLREESFVEIKKFDD